MIMNNNMNKKPLFDRRGKSGTYAVVMSLILLAVLVVVNMIVGSLPSKLTMIDTSGTGKFDISGTSQNFISGIKEKVTVYYICTDGYEDNDLETFVERYTSLNSGFMVKKVDPARDPSFLEQYGVEGLNENSLIVESEKRFKVIDYYDFFLFYNADINYSMSYDEYASYGAMYESYYGYTFTPVQYFDSVLTLGVEYVTAETIPSMYLLNGHGEAEFPEIVATNLETYGLKYDVINIALGDPIPEDCTCLVINNPSSDLTSVEAATVSNYLANGGNVLLITSAGADSFKNISSIASGFGLSAEAGSVNEGDSNAHVSNLPGYIYPIVSSTHQSVSFIAQQGYPVLVANSHAINVTEMSGVTVTPIFTTSDKAYSVVGDAKGEASEKNLAVVAEKSGEGKLLWIASGELLNESLISRTNGGNFYTFYTATAWLTGNYTSSLPEIPGIELSEALLVTTATDANVWGSILIFIVPGAVLGGGIAYWLWRRRR